LPPSDAARNRRSAVDAVETQIAGGEGRRNFKLRHYRPAVAIE
jgi:hypothetical protein